jgi:hypothetical protein
MALTKVQKTGITDNAIDADKIEDGTIVAADIAPGTITNAKLAGSIANDKLANSSITVNGSSVSLGGSVSVGKVQWQSVKTADFNAVAGEGYFVDTNSVGAVTATLPGSPSAGDTIAFKDYAGTFGTNSLTIARNGNNIQGVANDSEISTNKASIVLVYIDATKGWLYTNESNVADLQAPTFITATGGTVTTSGNDKIHTFTGDGCFTVSGISDISANNQVSYIVVGGGGSGGPKWAPAAQNATGGGGGAGGYREDKSPVTPYTASPLDGAGPITVTATSYPITVGGGGAQTPDTPPGSPGNDGSNSVFSTITSAGGGGGGEDTTAGRSGGSGGGGGGEGGTGGSGGSGNTPPVSPPQGQNGGGGGAGAPRYGSGGGGGASATGGGGSPTVSGDGGNGTTTSITGSPVARAGGGGGGGYCGSGGDGGSGGGGNGNGYYACGTAGTANTGGGGGGGGASGPGPATRASGEAGGKGIVIIRYKFQ